MNFLEKVRISNATAHERAIARKPELAKMKLIEEAEKAIVAAAIEWREWKPGYVLPSSPAGLLIAAVDKLAAIKEPTKS